MDKISDFQKTLADVSSHFEKYLKGDLIQQEQKTTSDTDIESYF